MGTTNFLKVFLCIVILHSVIAYPRSQSSSEEDTQQQQNVDSDSLEKFSQKINVKGRRPQKLQVTELEPEPEPYDPCMDRKKVGPCKANIPRFFFNQASGSCDRFRWGGCGKPGNNFKELTECETVCSKHLKKGKLDDETDQTSVLELCEKPAVNQGAQCMAYIPRWTYNATEQQCEEFIWGGCARTENNFATESSCQATCGEYPKARRELVDPNPNSSPKPGQTDLLQQQQNADIVDPPKPPLTKEDCGLPSDAGLCMAIFEKYYFNKLHNRCELFVYGGCGGNKNRFDTADECVRACGGDAPANDLECSNVECPWALYEHYTSLGCSPIFDGEACCPTRYECPDQQQEVQNNTLESRSLTLDRDTDDGTTTVEPETRKPQKCRYRGKFYSIGEKVDEASDISSCRASCFCSESDPELGPKIVCAQVECPEHLSRYAGGPGCVFLYNKTGCCANEFFCPQGPLTVIKPGEEPKPNEREPMAKCTVEGESYYEGQRVWPKKECMRCICQRDPNNPTSLEGTLDCEKIDCGIEIYYSHYLARGCAPVYYEKDNITSCCPISWQCPDDQEQERPTTESDNASADTTTPGAVAVAPEPPKPPSTDGPLPPTPPDAEKPSSALTRTHSACSMPKNEGECKGERPRFFFNQETKKCESFVYTGCKGNFNNFASVEDCEYLCLPKPAPAKGGGLLGRTRSIPQHPPQKISLTEVDPCTLPKKVGHCKGSFPRFYYSPENNECMLFIFGGCRPNANNFYSKDSCEATCLNKIPVENLRTSLPASLAHPNKAKWRTSDGGDSSKVNFPEERVFVIPTPAPPVPPVVENLSSSEEENPCTLPPRTGNCKAFVRRFYFDTDKQMCKPFTFGGCRPNANNFRTLQDCNQRCTEGRKTEPSPGQGIDVRSRTQGWRIATTEGIQGGNMQPPTPPTSARNSVDTAKCKLPKKEGSCHASIRSYYFDVESTSCKLFFYSGCFGNANRFSSREDCENQCKKPMELDGSSTNETINQPREPQVHDLTKPERSSAETPEPESQQKAFCKLDPAPGKCKANKLRFYYDSAAEECLPFVYTGCDGNQNNFVTETECMSSCGNKPTLEQLVDDMVLSCTFGTKTLPLGATVGGGGSSDEYHNEELPCGVPVCQCITPPAVTCVQRMCPEPTTTTTPPPTECPMLKCAPHCRPGTGPDGCPSCDCDASSSFESSDEETQVVVKDVPTKSVKG